MFYMVAFFIGISLVACGEKSAQTQAVNSNTAPNLVLSKPTNTNFLSLVSFDAHTQVKLDSPQKFIEVTILYNYQLSRWIYNLSTNQSLSTEQAEAFLETQIQQFYSNLGLTEAVYQAYANAHTDSISSFLESNTEYRTAYASSFIDYEQDGEYTPTDGIVPEVE